MSLALKQSTSVVILFGPFVDKTDGITPETGLVSGLDHATTGIMLSKNGAAQAVRNGTPTATTHDANGYYRVTLNTTDTGTLGILRVIYTETATCVPHWQDYMVLPANVWDSLYGADLLQVDTREVGGTTQTARDLGASVLLSNGTGTGQVKLSGGYVAPNWGDVGNPTTALALTATTIAVTQKVDLETIKTNPVVNAGTVTFPTTATLASTTNITAGIVTTATNVTTVNGLAANVITAASIAADAIGASELAADAITEIANAVWDIDATGHQTQGTFGQAIGDPVADTNTIYKAVVTDAAGATVGVDIVAVQADTDNIQTRLPAALVGGRIDASVGAVAAGAISAGAVGANAIDATALAADAVNEITAAIKALVVEVQGNYTVGQVLSILLSAVAGVTDDSGATLKTPDGVATRIAGTVAAGERTAITLTPSA
jgi:hypothetical protein